MVGARWKLSSKAEKRPVDSDPRTKLAYGSGGLMRSTGTALRDRATITQT
jgi:hypothetical protein